MTTEIDRLRLAVADETLDMTQRRTAAEHLVKLTLEAVSVSDTDPEVLELMRPWTDLRLAAIAADVTGGKSVHGHTLREAKAVVLKRKRQRTMYAIITDESAHRLERLACCSALLSEAPHDSVWRYNVFTPERLLDSVVNRTQIRQSSTGPRMVSRPPMEQGDLW